MKSQYVGDINDYRKYGLLRLLTRGGEINTTVCWMLTPNDGRGDGTRIGYLSQLEEWRDVDPQLFDHLGVAVLRCGRVNLTSLLVSTGDRNSRRYHCRAFA